MISRGAIARVQKMELYNGLSVGTIVEVYDVIYKFDGLSCWTCRVWGEEAGKPTDVWEDNLTELTPLEQLALSAE